MPIVVNSNASATEASFNLSRNNEALRKSLVACHPASVSTIQPMTLEDLLSHTS